MSRQVGVVKFDLGEKHSDIIVKDIRIWTHCSDITTSNDDNDDEQKTVEVWSYSGRFLQYVDLWSLPLWLQPHGNEKGDSIFDCYTMSKATMAYFSTKLKDQRRGIVIYFETHMADDSGIWIFFKNDTGDQVRCYPLDLHPKKLIDEQINELYNEHSSISRRDSEIDEILNKTKKRITITNKEVAKNLRINDKKLQFNETLSKLILGGLRLRGIPNTQSSFQRLYKMTFDASEFTYRDELKKMSKGLPIEVTFESLQETVEILLRLFTKS